MKEDSEIPEQFGSERKREQLRKFRKRNSRTDNVLHSMSKMDLWISMRSMDSMYFFWSMVHGPISKKVHRKKIQSSNKVTYRICWTSRLSTLSVLSLRSALSISFRTADYIIMTVKKGERISTTVSGGVSDL